MFLCQSGNRIEDVLAEIGIERTESVDLAIQINGPGPFFLILVHAGPMSEDALEQHARTDFAALPRAAKFSVAFDQEIGFFPGG